MGNHAWTGCRLLLRKRKKLLRKLTHSIALEADVTPHPEAVKHRKQQKGIFLGPPERFGFFNQRSRPLRSGTGFWRSMPLDVHQWRYESDLQIDLFAAKRGRAGQRGNMGKRAGELLNALNQCRTGQ